MKLCSDIPSYTCIYVHIFYRTLHIYVDFQHIAEGKKSSTFSGIVFMKLVNTHKLKKPNSNIFQSIGIEKRINIFIWPLPKYPVYLFPEKIMK